MGEVARDQRDKQMNALPPWPGYQLGIAIKRRIRISCFRAETGYIIDELRRLEQGGHTLPITPDPDAWGRELTETRSFWPKLPLDIKHAILSIARQVTA